MPSKFIEKHKRKSALAALLFFLGKRNVFVPLLVVVTLLSASVFIISPSGGVAGALLHIPGMAGLFKAIGVQWQPADYAGGGASSYSSGELKAIFDKAKAEGKADSFWTNFLKGISSELPSGRESVGLVTGGKEVVNIKQGKLSIATGSKSVKGIINKKDEKTGGKDGDAVDVGDMQARGTGGGWAGGGGGGLLSRGSGGAGGGAGEGIKSALGPNAPTAGSCMFANKAARAADNRGSSLAAALSSIAGKIPFIGNPAKPSNPKQWKQSSSGFKGKVSPGGASGFTGTGKVSAFTWAEPSTIEETYNSAIKKSGDSSMSQLADTFAMTGSAAISKNSPPEWKLASVGSNYDGNKMNDVPIITAIGAPPVKLPPGEEPPEVPEGPAVQKVLQEQVKKMILEDSIICKEAKETLNAAISLDVYNFEQQTAELENIKKPNPCCQPWVSRWNAKLSQLKSTCESYQAHSEELQSKCLVNFESKNCQAYPPQRVTWICCCNPCLLGCCGCLVCDGGGSGKVSWWDKFKKFIVPIALMVIGAVLIVTGIGALIGTGMVISGAAMLIGQLIGGTAGAAIAIGGSALGLVVGGPIAGSAILLAMMISAGINSQ
ncbi:MAG: hypothetical protein ABIG11_04380 [bacterium]